MPEFLSEQFTAHKLGVLTNGLRVKQVGRDCGMNNLERFTKAINWEPVDRILTYDFTDCGPLLEQLAGYDSARAYSWGEIMEVNALAWKNAGLDVTRYVYDPASHWMGGKIVNWIRFFGVDPDNWAVEQTGGTAWIAKRPFTDLRGLEKHMPQMPVYEDVRDWYAPAIRQMQETLAEHDIVFIGALEGPITDTYSYMDLELFCQRDLRGAGAGGAHHGLLR